MVVDLDRLGPLRLSLGPAAGDELLGAVAGRLAATLRRPDLLARLRPGAFALLLRETPSPREAIRHADEVLDLLRRPLVIGGAVVAPRASAGLAFAGSATDAVGLIGEAELAVARAKVDGGDRWSAFEPALHAVAAARDGLARELDQAIDAGALTLEFQPERRIAGALGQAGTIRSVEALVRWRHPARGLVRPADFLPVAEQTGSIDRIGAWVLREAAAHARSWQLTDPGYARLSVGVNLSAREIGRPGLVAEVVSVLAATGLAPATLTLEVTIAAITHDPERAVATLAALRATGVRIALDDFAGDANTLGTERRATVDVVKIDPNLVAAVASDRGSERAIRAIVQVARDRGIETVAEGVETREQLAALRELGCDLAQGYLFGKPLGASGISAVLRAERRRGDRVSA